MLIGPGTGSGVVELAETSPAGSETVALPRGLDLAAPPLQASAERREGGGPTPTRAFCTPQELPLPPPSHLIPCRHLMRSFAAQRLPAPHPHLPQQRDCVRNIIAGAGAVVGSSSTTPRSRGPVHCMQRGNVRPAPLPARGTVSMRAAKMLRGRWGTPWSTQCWPTSRSLSITTQTLGVSTHKRTMSLPARWCMMLMISTRLLELRRTITVRAPSWGR